MCSGLRLLLNPLRLAWIGLLLLPVNLLAQEHGLDYYLSQAKNNSPLLKDYRNQVQSNRIDSLRLLAGYGTQVTGSSYGMYAPVVNGWGYDNAITNGANLSAIVGVSRQILGKDNLQNQLDAFGLQNQLANISGRVSEEDLQLAVSSQYINAWGSWKQTEYNREVLDLLSREEKILKKLTESAVYRQTDYLSFLVTLQQQQTLFDQDMARYRYDLASLNYLCGITDTAYTQLQAPAISSREPMLPEQTVFFRKYQLDSLQLRNADSRIDFSYKPVFHLFADAGYLSSLALTPYKNFGLSLGVSLTVPIYDGHQRKMQHDKISIAEDTREKYQSFFSDQYRQQTALLSQQLNLSRQISRQTEERLRYVQGLIDANRKLLQTGDARIADFILAIGNYLSARQTLVQQEVSQWLLINQLNYWNAR